MTVPPSADPIALIPKASDLRFLNQCEMMIGIGPKIIPHENPVRKPWQRRSCQNSLHSAMAAVATTRITLTSSLSAGVREVPGSLPGNKQGSLKVAEVTKPTGKKPRKEN